jgi:hypothetical protein
MLAPAAGPKELTAMTETLPPKRYRFRVFVCANCGGLADTSRAHAVTCSNVCRVSLHRHPENFADLRETCVAARITPAMVLECMAVKQLRPDLLDKIRAGTLEIEHTREHVHREYLKRLGLHA